MPTPLREVAQRSYGESIESVWEAYRQKPSHRLRNRLIEHYLPVVRKTARRMRARLPREVEEDDLHQAGVFGLMRSIDTFDSSRGVRFENYATFRIRGAILDEIRAMDWVPRLVRHRCTRLERARRQLRQRAGSDPNEGDVARALGVDMKTYRKMARDAQPTVIVSINSSLETDSPDRPIASQGVQDDRKRHRLDAFDRSDLRDLLSAFSGKQDTMVLDPGSDFFDYFKDAEVSGTGQ